MISLRSFYEIKEGPIVRALNQNQELISYITMMLELVDFERTELGILELIYYIGYKTRINRFRMKPISFVGIGSIIIDILRSIPEVEEIYRKQDLSVSVFSHVDYVSTLKLALSIGKARRGTSPIFSHWKTDGRHTNPSEFDNTQTIIDNIIPSRQLTLKQLSALKTIRDGYIESTYTQESDTETSDDEADAIIVMDTIADQTPIMDTLVNINNEMDVMQGKLDKILEDL